MEFIKEKVTLTNRFTFQKENVITRMLQKKNLLNNMPTNLRKKVNTNKLLS